MGQISPPITLRQPYHIPVNSTFVTKNGTVYTIDANGEVQVTNTDDLKDFLSAGFQQAGYKR